MLRNIILIYTLLALTSACFFSFNKKNKAPLPHPKYLRTVTELPLGGGEGSWDLDETRLLKYAKYAKSGFAIEVEERLDKKTRIRQITQTGNLPQNDTFDDDKTLFEVANDEPSLYELNYTGDPLVEVIVEPMTPPIHSQVMNGGGGGGENGGGLTPEDIAVRKDWEGDCMASDWEHCSRLESISRMRVHNKTAKGVVVWIDWQMDCRNTHVDTNITCLDNGWTVNRCQLICMAKCNKLLLQPNVYSKKVKHAGPCVYI